MTPLENILAVVAGALALLTPIIGVKYRGLISKLQLLLTKKEKVDVVIDDMKQLLDEADDILKVLPEDLEGMTPEKMQEIIKEFTEVKVIVLKLQKDVKEVLEQEPVVPDL